MVSFSRIFLFFGLLLGCGIFPFSMDGQVLADPELCSLFESDDLRQPDYSSPLKTTSREIDIVFSFGFLLYKTCISSQDTPSCVFTPSCSEYAVQAIKKKGLIVGWLTTFDRLSRCHGLVRPTDYPFDHEKQRFYDPVE
jgi:putative component of membrane protein insertase Oxa1/YidC/SpoIIIJ protein YidD